MALIVVALAFGARVGPGALLMAIVLGVGFFIGAPVLQLFLGEAQRLGPLLCRVQSGVLRRCRGRVIRGIVHGCVAWRRDVTVKGHNDA